MVQGWHKDRKYLLNNIENIEIILQPPYSPELNPVEKLWQYIKNHTIKNKAYKTLDNLEDEVCKFIQNNLTKDVVMNICKTKDNK